MWAKDLYGREYLACTDWGYTIRWKDKQGNYTYAFGLGNPMFPLEMPIEGIKKITKRAAKYQINWNFAELYHQTFTNYKHGKG